MASSNWGSSAPARTVGGRLHKKSGPRMRFPAPDDRTSQTGWWTYRAALRILEAVAAPSRVAARCSCIERVIAPPNEVASPRSSAFEPSEHVDDVGGVLGSGVGRDPRPVVPPELLGGLAIAVLDVADQQVVDLQDAPSDGGATPAGAFEQYGFTRGRQVGKHAWIMNRVVDPV